MEIIRENLFSIPIWKTQLDFDNDLFLDYLKKLASSVSMPIDEHTTKWNGPGSVSDHFINRNNKFSTKNNIECNSPIVKQLINQIDIAINSIACSLGILDNCRLNIIDFWFNYQKGPNIDDVHMHENSILSIVYYPIVPDGCSKLNLVRASHTEVMFWSSFLKINDKDVTDHSKAILSLTNTSIKYAPTPGSLIIFPSFLQHYVESSLDPNCPERLSIAFNSDLGPSNS